MIDNEYHAPPPEEALVIEEGSRDGWYWLHLASAEDFLREYVRVPHFPVDRLAGTGGLKEGGDEPAGLVSLRDRAHRTVLMGSFICGGLQFPTHSDPARSASSLREEFAEAILALENGSAVLFADGAPQSLRP